MALNLFFISACLAKTKFNYSYNMYYVSHKLNYLHIYTPLETILNLTMTPLLVFSGLGTGRLNLKRLSLIIYIYI